jgi:hypothetical protein
MALKAVDKQFVARSTADSLLVRHRGLRPWRFFLFTQAELPVNVLMLVAARTAR